MPRHSAPQSPLRSLRTSVRGLPAVLALGSLAVVTAFGLLLALDQRHVWGQPDEVATVQGSTPLGRDIGYSRSGCAGHRFQATVPTPRADLPVREASFEDCAGAHRPGDQVMIRRVPGHPGRTFAEPRGFRDFALWAPLSAVAGLVLLLVGHVLLDTARELRRRRRLRARRPHR